LASFGDSLVGPSGDTTWGTYGNIASNKASSIAKKTGVLRMSDWSGYFPHFEAILTSTWAEVAPKWVEVGFQVHAKLRYLVAQLVQVGGLAGRS